jgi:hypothetical protein
MTLQQLVFLGEPTTSPVVAENLRTSMEAGPESWSRFYESVSTVIYI